MFTMTIKTASGVVLAKRESLPGEGWKATLVRLHEAVEPPGEGRHRVISRGRWDGEMGQGKTSATPGYFTGGPDDSSATLIIETDPPQF